MSDEAERIRDPDAAEGVDHARRAALVRMGKYAGFAAPAVITLLTVDAPTAWASSAPIGANPGRPRPIIKILKKILGL